jgi:hypothetical protein
MKIFKSVQKMYDLVCGCRKATVDRDYVKKKLGVHCIHLVILRVRSTNYIIN